MVDRAGRNLTINSDSWGETKVTIPNPAAAISPDSKAVLSCRVYSYSGSGVIYISPLAADNTGPVLPTTFAMAVSMPVVNLNQMSFFGTAGDVAMIVWRT